MQDEIQIKSCLVDLDGTLVDVEEIRWMVTGKRKNFHDFHMQSIHQPPILHVLNLIRKLHENGYKIFVMTGRESKYRDISLEWLEKYQIEFSGLIMRKEGDYRSDIEVKSELFNDHLSNANVVIAIDDKASLRELWDRSGVETVLEPDECQNYINEFLN